MIQIKQSTCQTRRRPALPLQTKAIKLMLTATMAL
jgi:hypothetical protein